MIHINFFSAEETFSSEGGNFFAGFFGNFDPRSNTRISKIRFSIDPVSRSGSTVFIEALGQTRTISAPEEVEYDAQQLNLKKPCMKETKECSFPLRMATPSLLLLMAEEFQSSDAFKVLPSIKLPSDTYEYYAVSVPISQIPVEIDDEYADYYENYDVEFEDIEGNSAIVIVTTEDDTTLQLTLTQTIQRNNDLGNDLKDQIPSEEILAGQTVTINLPERMQTLYLPSENDLSGSRMLYLISLLCSLVVTSVGLCPVTSASVIRWWSRYPQPPPGVGGSLLPP